MSAEAWIAAVGLVLTILGAIAYWGGRILWCGREVVQKADDANAAINQMGKTLKGVRRDMRKHSSQLLKQGAELDQHGEKIEELGAKVDTHAKAIGMLTVLHGKTIEQLYRVHDDVEEEDEAGGD